MATTIGSSGSAEENEFTRRKVAKISLLRSIFFFGTLFALIYHRVIVPHLHHPMLRDTYLQISEDRYNDYFNYLHAFAKDGIDMTIFPTVNLFFFLLFPLTGGPTFVAIVLLVVLYTFYFFLRALQTRQAIGKEDIVNAIVFTFCTYPLLFAFDRGNIEMVMFILVSGYVFLFQARCYVSASLLLALAIGMKLFPAVFIVLYLKEKKYRELLFMFVFLAVLSGGLYLFQDWNIVMRQTRWFLDFYRNDYIIGDAGLLFGHSLFGLGKTVFYGLYSDGGGSREAAHEFLRLNSTIILQTYTAFTFLVYGIAAVYIYFSKRLSLWKEIAILTLLFCCLPNVSADYKLLHLYTPLMLFLTSREVSSNERSLTVFFGLLLIPKAYYYFWSGGSTGTLIEPILMIALLISILIDKPIFIPSSEKSTLQLG